MMNDMEKYYLQVKDITLEELEKENSKGIGHYLESAIITLYAGADKLKTSISFGRTDDGSEKSTDLSKITVSIDTTDPKQKPMCDLIYKAITSVVGGEYRAFASLENRPRSKCYGCITPTESVTDLTITDVAGRLDRYKSTSNLTVDAVYKGVPESIINKIDLPKSKIVKKELQ